LISVKSKLDNLPLELEVIELYGNCSECCLDYLQSSLKTLVIQSNLKTSLDNLSSTLENLFLLSEYTQDLKNLPSKLKFLHINSQAKINIILPKHMECIMYPEDNNWLRRWLLKKNHKISYNDVMYENSIKIYDIFNNNDEYDEDEDDEEYDDDVLIYNN